MHLHQLLTNISLWSLCDMEHWLTIKLFLLVQLQVPPTTVLMHMSRECTGLYSHCEQPSIPSTLCVWLTFCTWCFPGCACSVVLAEEPPSLVASVGSTTPARRRRRGRRRAWMAGGLMSIFIPKWKICYNSVAALYADQFTAFISQPHAQWMRELNWAEVTQVQGYQMHWGRPQVVSRFYFWKYPCILLLAPLSWHTGLWSSRNKEWVPSCGSTVLVVLLTPWSVCLLKAQQIELSRSWPWVRPYSWPNLPPSSIHGNCLLVMYSFNYIEQKPTLQG